MYLGRLDISSEAYIFERAISLAFFAYTIVAFSFSSVCFWIVVSKCEPLFVAIRLLRLTPAEVGEGF